MFTLSSRFASVRPSLALRSIRPLSIKPLSLINEQQQLKSTIETNAGNRIPRSVLYLGLGGLIPFAAPVLIAAAMPELTFLMQDLQAQYGAVILSFMGGAQWGLAMVNYGNMNPRNNTIRYILSVLPPLLAFASFNIYPWPCATTLLIQAGSFQLLYAFDAFSSRWGFAPVWYAGLRLRLTVLVNALVISLVLLGVKRGRDEKLIGHIE